MIIIKLLNTEIYLHVFIIKDLYPNNITNIKERKIRNNKKRAFRKACEHFSIDNNKCLWQIRKFKDLFDGKLKVANFLIITKKEF